MADSFQLAVLFSITKTSAAYPFPEGSLLTFSVNFHHFLRFLIQCASSHGVVAWSSKAWVLNSTIATIANGQLVSMPFKKSRNDTYLRLTWSSSMRQQLHKKCSEWFFKINNEECSSPASISGLVYHAIEDHGHSHHSYQHRHGTVVGVCQATRSGKLTSSSYEISMNIRDCPGYSGSKSDTGWRSASTIMVEELCPPQ